MGWETYKRNHAGDELSDAAQAAWSDNVMIRQLLAKREVAKSEQFNVFMVLSITLCQIVSNVRMSDTDRARVQAPGSDSSAKGMFVYRQILTQLSSYTTSPNTGSWLLIFSVPCSSKPEGANEFEVSSGSDRDQIALSHVSGPRMNDIDLPLDSSSRH
jgi:hypothetical protein